MCCQVLAHFRVALDCQGIISLHQSCNINFMLHVGKGLSVAVDSLSVHEQGPISLNVCTLGD